MKKLATIAAHGLEPEKQLLQSVSSPIFQTAAFAFENFAQLRDYAQGRVSRHIYSRYSNPTTSEAETILASLEGTEAAVATSSGMAATFIAILAALAPGEEVLSLETIYGGTFKMFKELLPRLGINVRFIGVDDLANNLNSLADYITPQTRLLWLETPTNPTNRLVDLAAVSHQAHKLGLRVAVDNTFATPINQRPINFGVDIIVHSATKYLGGHDDLTAGFIAADNEFIKQAHQLHKLIGTTLDPHAAALLIRGMRTLDVRMERINRNALALSEFCAQAEQVKRVYYPFWQGSAEYALACRQMSGGSGIVSIDLGGNLPAEVAAEKFIDGLKMIPLVATLGGVETKLSYPFYTSHVGLTEIELERAGVSPATIRFAVGIEASEDIIADVAQALTLIAD